ncbi:MAG: alpha/beta fold hydrolase [Candidatus Aminicenantes bacterium]|nr:alpha/beta fold hydrolase [Candidatus Aminicenantes bacterium]
MTTAIYSPQPDGPRERMPLILALHFGGPVTPTTGRDFAEMLVLPALRELGAVILAPNCPGRGWTDPISEEALLKLIAVVRKRFLIDKRRVAVTGFSMGAIGAYRLAARHPELFKAAIPVSGIPSSEDLASLRDMPLFIIHSDGDEVFPMDEAGPAFEILRQKNPATRIDILGGLSHYQTAAYVPALKKAAAWLKKAWKSR